MHKAATVSTLFALILLGCAGSSPRSPLNPVPDKSVVTDPDPLRFSAEIEAFEAWDAKNAVPEEGLLFVGSSSIRLWDTADRFPGYPIVNRGFGGSHISDVNTFVDRVVLKYRPAVVVFYAGDNDVAGGKSADDVVEDFSTFVSVVRASLPDARIIWLPIKPSLQRWALWPTMRDANERIRALTDADDQLFYADLATPMLGEDGRPAPNLFSEDGLHLNAVGYDLWSETLRPTLRDVWRTRR